VRPSALPLNAQLTSAMTIKGSSNTLPYFSLVTRTLFIYKTRLFKDNSERHQRQSSAIKYKLGRKENLFDKALYQQRPYPENLHSILYSIISVFIQIWKSVTL